MQFEAAHNNVVVQMDGASDQEIGLILLPSVARETRNTGTVLSVGPSVKEKEIKAGVRVLFPPYGLGEAFLRDGKRYIILLDHEILGVIR